MKPDPVLDDVPRCDDDVGNGGALEDEQSVDQILNSAVFALAHFAGSLRVVLAHDQTETGRCCVHVATVEPVYFDQQLWVPFHKPLFYFQEKKKSNQINDPVPTKRIGIAFSSFKQQQSINRINGC